MWVINQKGTTISLLIMAILLLSMLGMVTASIVSMDSDEAYLQERESEGGFIGDGAVEYALTKLRGSFSWGGLPSPGRVIGNGSFTVSPPSSQDEQGKALPVDQRRVVVTATVSGFTKSLRVKIGTFSFGAYIDSTSGLVGGSPAVAEPRVTGNIYVDGYVDTTTFQITGIFYVPADHDTGEIYPDPQPTFSTLGLPDTTTYGNLLTTAKGKPAGNYTLGASLNLTTLAESTLYVNGNFSASGNKDITGPGKIVVFGTTSFGNNITVGDRVTIISQYDATVTGVNTVLWSDSTLTQNIIYSRKKVVFNANTARGTLFGAQSLAITGNSVVRGKAFTYGEAELNRATIYGYWAARSILNEQMPRCVFYLGTQYFPSLQATRVPGSFREL